MTIPRALIQEIRSLDEFDLRRLMIFVRGLLVQHGEAPGRGDEEPRPQAAKVSYRLEGVSCGKQGCTKCPHGPYWYAYWREDGRLKTRYIGKELPKGAAK